VHSPAADLATRVVGGMRGRQLTRRKRVVYVGSSGLPVSRC
jgi:hypothetical protein